MVIYSFTVTGSSRAEIEREAQQRADEFEGDWRRSGTLSYMVRPLLTNVSGKVVTYEADVSLSLRR
jgi:hypothetical protein